MLTWLYSRLILLDLLLNEITDMETLLTFFTLVTFFTLLTFFLFSQRFLK